MATLVRTRTPEERVPLVSSIPSLPTDEELTTMRGAFAPLAGSKSVEVRPPQESDKQTSGPSIAPGAARARQRYVAKDGYGELGMLSTGFDDETTSLLFSDGLSHDQSVREPMVVPLVVPQYPRLSQETDDGGIEMENLRAYPRVAAAQTRLAYHSEKGADSATDEVAAIKYPSHIMQRATAATTAYRTGTSSHRQVRDIEHLVPAAVRGFIAGASPVFECDDELPAIRQCVDFLREAGIDVESVAAGTTTNEQVLANEAWTALRSSILEEVAPDTPSLLSASATRRQPAMLRLLLRLAGDCSGAARAGRVRSRTPGPLAAAVAANSGECVRILLESGVANPNEVSGSRVTSALIAGVQEMSAEGVAALLEARSSIRGLLPLHADAGTDARDQYAGGSTPPGAPSAPPAEPQAGAGADFFRYESRQPSWRALFGERPDRSSGAASGAHAGMSAMVAAASGQAAAELDLDWKDPLTGNTAMHVAAGQGWAEMCALLAWYGADVSCLNDAGRTPRQLGVEAVSKYSKVVEVLEELESSGVHLLADDGTARVLGGLPQLRRLGRRYGFGWRHRGRPAGRVRALVLWRHAVAASSAAASQAQ